MSDLLQTYSPEGFAGSYGPNGGLDMARAHQAQSQIDAVKRATTLSDPDIEAARKTAEDFEAVFLSQMLQPIFGTIPENSLFGEGPGHKVYQSMMVQEMGKEMAKSGGIGIADHIFSEILKLQEG